MSEQAILITGTSSGFGLLGAKALARRGHRVFAGMRDPGGKNEKAATELRSFSEGAKIEVLDLDVRSTEAADAAVARVVRDAGRIDVLINNAGVMNTGITEAFTPEQFAAQLDTNLVGAFRLARAALPEMRKRKSGLVVNVSSIGGRVVFPFGGVYAASKWGLEALSEALRYEVSSFGVEVVVLEPGLFATSLLANSPAPADAKCIATYGEVAQKQAGMNAGIAHMYNAYKDATDPAIVAGEFVKLVEAPAWKRPFRSVAGLDFGTAKLNELTDPWRHEVLKGLGLADFEPVKNG